MEKNDRLRRRDILKTTGGIVGGLAMSGALSTSVAAQSTYFRYQQVRVQLIDVDTIPPRFLTAESPLYLPQALLAQCNTDHPCSLDVLDYRRTGDDDDDDDNDDDDACPGFASVVLLCHGESASEAVVVTGLIRDVLSRFSEQGMDYVINITPSSGTNINDPERVSNPCPSTAGGDDDDQVGDDDGDDDDNAGQDDDDGGDDGDDDDADDDRGGDDDDGDNDNGDDG